MLFIKVSYVFVDSAVVFLSWFLLYKLHPLNILITEKISVWVLVIAVTVAVAAAAAAVVVVVVVVVTFNRSKILLLYFYYSFDVNTWEKIVG